VWPFIRRATRVLLWQQGRLREDEAKYKEIDRRDNDRIGQNLIYKETLYWVPKSRDIHLLSKIDFIAAKFTCLEYADILSLL